MTLVIGKISYEDNAWIETLRKLGFGYQTIVSGKGLEALLSESNQ